MSFSLNAVFSLSIGIGTIISWFRFYKTDPAFTPFISLLTIGLLNEIAGIIIAEKGYSNAFTYNLYTLIEAVLITWQFGRWGLFRHRVWVYYLLQVFYVASWNAEWLTNDGHRIFNSYFMITHAIIIVLMSISQINRLLFGRTRHLGKEPVFLICCGMTVYFTYAVLVEAFWVYGLNQSLSFRLGIYGILSYINLFTNLLFAYAALWMPLKKQYIMRS